MALAAVTSFGRVSWALLCAVAVVPSWVLALEASTNQDSSTDHEYVEAVRRYYQAISERDFETAYSQLSQCSVTLYSADGSGVAYHPRRKYRDWLAQQENVDSLAVLEIRRFDPGPDYSAETGDAEATLGIRMYEVSVGAFLRKEGVEAVRSGRRTWFIAVAKGTDGVIRILGIGSGP